MLMPVARPSHVFISHSTRDEAIATRIKLILDRLGLRAFVYGHSPWAGRNRFAAIAARLRECSYVVVLLTRSAEKSPWVNQEIGFAAALEKAVVPLVELRGPRGRRIAYFGFTELSDPINLRPAEPEEAIRDLLLSVASRARSEGRWRGTIRLKCICGRIGSYRVRNLTVWQWDCKVCGRRLTVSPVTYEPLAQADEG